MPPDLNVHNIENLRNYGQFLDFSTVSSPVSIPPPHLYCPSSLQDLKMFENAFKIATPHSYLNLLRWLALFRHYWNFL
jgi:hypothetical protein